MAKYKKLALVTGAFSAVALLLSACATGPSTTGGSDEQVVVIGAVEMLTGSSAFYGQAVLSGIETAVDEINADGGILGHTIELKSYDNASDNAQTVTLVRRLADDRSVPVIIAPTYQANFGAACATATSIGIAVIGADSQPAPANQNTEGYCFSNAPDGEVQVKQTLDGLHERFDATRFGQIFDQQNAHQTLHNELGEEYVTTKQGWVLPVNAGVDTGQIDYSTVISDMNRNNLDVVMVNLTTEDAARFISQARDLGLKALFSNASTSLVTERLYELSNGAAEGLIVTTPQSESDEGFAKFVTAFEQDHGPLPDPIAGYGYDAMMILKEAMVRAGTVSDRDAIRDALLQHEDEFCPSICYKQNAPGAFQTTKLVWLALTKDGFEALSSE